MNLVHSVLSWLLPGVAHRRPDATERLEAVSQDIAIASEIASYKAEAVLEAAKADQAVAENIVTQLQERLALQERRRSQRIRDPRLNVIVETIRILEGRA
ncbi:hypothetical protein [Methylobacterium mesophilicum]